MADILNALVHNKTVPKLIETNNFMIINGNLYNKGNLAPANKKIFSFGSDLGNNILHISRSMHLMDDARKDNRASFKDIKEDKYIENRSYIILNNQYANVNGINSYILSLTETDEDVSILNSFTINNLIFQEILSITENYIILSAKTLTAYYGHPLGCASRIICLNKSNLSLVKEFQPAEQYRLHTDNADKGNVFKLYEDNGFLYRAIGGQSEQVTGYGLQLGDRITVCKLRKSSLEYELLFIDNMNNWGDTPIANVDTINDIYKIDSKLYFFKRRICINDSMPSNHTGIYKIVIDTSKPLGTSLSNTQIIDLSLNSTSGWKNILFRDRICTQSGYFIKDNNIFYYSTDETNSSSNILNYQGIHKIEIAESFDLTYIKRINPSTSNRIISILFDENYETIIIGYWQSFDILVYNDVTQEYQKRGNTYTGIKNVGLDALNRLWYETIPGEIHTENFDDPQEIEVKFEKPYYSYGKTPIHTYLTFKAKSATGAIPSGRYTLTITSNNAYFEETGDNILYIEYNNVSQDDIHYPVVITAARRVVCSISFEKAW